MTSTTDELLKTDTLGRVSTPPVKRELILDEFDRSGMSAKAFAEHIGVKYTTFANWVQRRRKDRGEVRSTRKADSSKTEIALVEAFVSDESVSDGLLIEAAGGVRIRVRHRNEIALAIEVLKALQ